MFGMHQNDLGMRVGNADAALWSFTDESGCWRVNTGSMSATLCGPHTALSEALREIVAPYKNLVLLRLMANESLMKLSSFQKSAYFQIPTSLLTAINLHRCVIIIKFSVTILCFPLITLCLTNAIFCSLYNYMCFYLTAVFFSFTQGKLLK